MSAAPLPLEEGFGGGADADAEEGVEPPIRRAKSAAWACDSGEISIMVLAVARAVE